MLAAYFINWIVSYCELLSKRSSTEYCQRYRSWKCWCNITGSAAGEIPKQGHGTGCTLSSAIAANLAKGFEFGESVKKSIEFVHGALDKGFKIGSENYVLDCFWEND